MLVADAVGEVRYVNRVFSRMMGQPAVRLHGSTLFEHFDCDWLGEALLAEDRVEHGWRPVALVGQSAIRFELAHHRVRLELASKPLHVLLVRSRSPLRAVPSRSA